MNEIILLALAWLFGSTLWLINEKWTVKRKMVFIDMILFIQNLPAMVFLILALIFG